MNLRNDLDNMKKIEDLFPYYEQLMDEKIGKINESIGALTLTVSGLDRSIQVLVSKSGQNWFWIKVLMVWTSAIALFLLAHILGQPLPIDKLISL